MLIDMNDNDLTRKDDLAIKAESFIKNAQDFCLLVEGNDDVSFEDFFKKLSYSLVGLYLVAFSLPDVEPDDDNETPDYTNAKNINDIRRSIEISLAKKLQDHDKYYEVFDPRFPRKEDPIECDLSADIADIYSDVKTALENYHQQTGGSINNSIWDWKDDFQHHWGNHLVDALRVIHGLLYM